MKRTTRNRRRRSRTGLTRADRRAYEAALRQALAGSTADAQRALLELLEKPALAPPWRARITSDLAALRAVNGDLDAARDAWQAALALDPACEDAHQNLRTLATEITPLVSGAQSDIFQSYSHKTPVIDQTPCKVVIVSFLFNWPSTAGGIIHTVELATFLSRAGYEVRHYFARYEPWNLGTVKGRLPSPSQAIEFSEREWVAETIQRRFRAVVDEFGPEYVIITDAWNFSSWRAMRGYKYYLRQQSQECLCPLNNLRLLIDADGSAVQCPRHQLATPDVCLACLNRRAQFSGGLHQAERALSGVGTARYAEQLRAAYREAEAVLVLNPMIEAVTAPYAGQVKVVTWGMDPARFPWPWPNENRAPPEKKAIFMAGVVEEPIKGLRVLGSLCPALASAAGFRLVATASPPARSASSRGLPVGCPKELPGSFTTATCWPCPRLLKRPREHGRGHGGG